MRCPFCQSDHDKVIDSRTTEEGFAIRRRRICLDCKCRYTTRERLEEMAIKIVKKGGIREPYRREKIRSGLMKACWKRPVGDEEIDALVSDVERELYSQFNTEIPSTELGDMVMLRLKKLDQVAFVRFASVYREFEDVSDFVQELRLLRDNEDLS